MTIKKIIKLLKDKPVELTIEENNNFIPFFHDYIYDNPRITPSGAYSYYEYARNIKYSYEKKKKESSS